MEFTQALKSSIPFLLIFVIGFVIGTNLAFHEITKMLQKLKEKSKSPKDTSTR